MLTFGNEVRRARLAAGLTQQELADRIGSDQRGVSLDENWGRGASTPRRVRALGRALNLSDAVQTRGLLEYVAGKDAQARAGLAAWTADLTPAARVAAVDQAFAELLAGLPNVIEAERPPLVIRPER